MTAKDYHKEVTEHLEFLGYEIEDLKAEQGYLYIAKSANKNSIIVRVFKNTTILTTKWTGYKITALKSKDFYETMNNINQSSMSKWYYEVNEKDEDIRIVTEVDYYDYNKTTFGVFVSNLETEVQGYIQMFDKFVKE